MSQPNRWTEFAESVEAAADEPPKARENERPQPEDPTPFSGRVLLLVLVFLVFALAIFVRLTESVAFSRASQPEQGAAAPVDPPRGRIVESLGLLLATDTFFFEIYVDPKIFKDAKGTFENVAAMADAIQVPRETLQTALDQPGRLALVTKSATAVQCQAARAGPGWIWCDERRQRHYPQGQLAAHVLGFVNRDRAGQYGVEATFDSWLRAGDDWSGRQLPGEPAPLSEELRLYLPSPAGRDLILHLNSALQHRVEARLVEALQEYQASAGTIIILEASTSAVLALANWPSYDPNGYAEAEPESWQNSAVAQLYEPGSAFKPFTYAAAIESGAISLDEVFYDSGEYTVGHRRITNALERVYGTVGVHDALANSINTVTAEICMQMGAGTFYRYVRQFGFGRSSEVDLMPQSSGIVKQPNSAIWSPADQAANSFGQGIATTPLQLANAFAAIANDGTLMQPQVVAALVDNGLVYRIPPRTLGQAVQPETAQTLRQMLVYTMENYEAGPGLVPGFRVAGKTGTAEIPEEEGYTSSLTITSFVGFFPAADPEVVILVKLERPRSSRWAEEVALPTFGMVAGDAVQVLKLSADDRWP